jgi:diguanylate cyclase (GGDEF)-like protein
MAKTPPAGCFESGASRTRTGDLLGAIQALSQLSYSPGWDLPITTEAHGGLASVPGERILVTVSFGRRLALFFLLIAIVPVAAVIGILVFVSQDSQRGKADARLASGLQTAVSIYNDRSAAATGRVRHLAGSPELATALKSGNPGDLSALTRQVASDPGVVRIEILDNADNQTAAAGLPGAVAFATVGLTEQAKPVGSLRLSTTTAEQYADAVHRLTGQQVILRRGGVILASTVPRPSKSLEPDETADVSAGGADYRAHATALDRSDGLTIVMLGPPKSGGFLGIGRPALAILVWFLVTAVVLAWTLARMLTRLHQRVQEQAVTDPLTGLWNRRHMAQTLEREVARSLRFGHPISLIILDVDDFKQINDREGHLQGDMVLEAVAQVVLDGTRSIDVAARYGGDELAVVLVETDREGALILGERLADRMRSTQVPLREGEPMAVTISLGVATIPDSAHDLDSLVDAADRALLRAKRAGKNQIRAAPATHLGSGSEEAPRRFGLRGRTPERKP